MSGNDELQILGLEVFAHHGVFDFERQQGQKFIFDLVIGLDVTPAAATDKLDKTLDYGELTQQVVSLVQKEPVNLIETLAVRIADLCLTDPIVNWVKVTVHKPQAPISAKFADVTLTITRRKS